MVLHQNWRDLLRQEDSSGTSIRDRQQQGGNRQKCALNYFAAYRVRSHLSVPQEEIWTDIWPIGWLGKQGPEKKQTGSSASGKVHRGWSRGERRNQDWKIGGEGFGKGKVDGHTAGRSADYAGLPESGASWHPGGTSRRDLLCHPDVLPGSYGAGVLRPGASCLVAIPLESRKTKRVETLHSAY